MLSELHLPPGIPSIDRSGVLFVVEQYQCEERQLIPGCRFQPQLDATEERRSTACDVTQDQACCSLTARIWPVPGTVYAVPGKNMLPPRYQAGADPSSGPLHAVEPLSR
jgi:hypothetical protein